MDDRTQALLDAARSADPELRHQAALQLGTERPADALDELVALLVAETQVPVVETLTWAVVAYHPACVPVLLRALDELPDGPGAGQARVRLLHALSKTGGDDPAFDERARAEVLRWADDADPAVAARAWWALARLGVDPQVLVDHLGQSDPEQGQALLRALVERGPDAVDALAGALASSDEHVSAQAAEALVRLIDPMTRGTRARALVSDRIARAEQALVDTDSPAAVEVVRLLSMDERPGIAESAQDVLARREQRP